MVPSCRSALIVLYATNPLRFPATPGDLLAVGNLEATRFVERFVAFTATKLSLAAGALAVALVASACTSANTAASPSADETAPATAVPTTSSVLLGEQRDLITARARWAQAKPATYVVTATVGAGMQAPIECRWGVSGAEVALMGGPNTPRCLGQKIRTPEDAFGSIEAALASPAKLEVQVTYNAQGVPISAAIVIPNTADGNRGWTMTVQSA